MKRFQECNWVERLWRYRYYLYLPFKWLWYQYVRPFKVIDDQSFEEDVVKGRQLWKLLMGMVQLDMKWTYSHEEVKARFLGKDEADYWKGIE